MRKFARLSCLFVVLGLLAAGCGRSSGKVRLAFVSNNPHGFWTYAERGCEQETQTAESTGLLADLVQLGDAGI